MYACNENGGARAAGVVNIYRVYFDDPLNARVSSFATSSG